MMGHVREIILGAQTRTRGVGIPKASTAGCLGRSIWVRLTGVANVLHDYLCVRSVQRPQAPFRTLEIEAWTHASGFVHAEEISVLILKRLVEAEGDKEQIYAVIRGCNAPA